MTRRLAGPILAMALIAIAASTAACGSGDSAGDDRSDAGDRAAGGARDEVTIEYVGHGPTSNEFLSVVYNGTQQAGKDLTAKVNYRGPRVNADFGDQARLARQAIAAKPDGIALTYLDADAMKPVIQEAADAGIPVILGATSDLKMPGVLGTVGGGEAPSGGEAGEKMKAEGVSNAACLEDAPIKFLDDICASYIDAVGGGKSYVVDPTNPTEARGRIKAILREGRVDGIFTTARDLSEAALDALEETGQLGEVRLAGFVTSPKIFGAIRDGDMLFAIDQQQYLQGYLAVQQLVHYARYGFVPVGHTYTGPAFVDKSNVDVVERLSKERIR
jgi:simple sugar transport system substrate-binding protein